MLLEEEIRKVVEKRADEHALENSSYNDDEFFQLAGNSYKAGAALLLPQLVKAMAALERTLQYCPDKTGKCAASKTIKADTCVIYDHRLARETLTAIKRELGLDTVKDTLLSLDGKACRNPEEI